MKKLMLLFMTLLMCLGYKSAEAANITVVLDVPSIIYKDSVSLAKVDKTPFIEKFPQNSVLRPAAEGVAAAKDYRIRRYNAEMNADRHNGYCGYKKAFTLDDLSGIAREQNCEYVMFIKTYGVFEKIKDQQKVYNPIMGQFGKKWDVEKTALTLYFNCKVYNAQTWVTEAEQKFSVQEKSNVVINSKLAHDNLYKQAFSKGISTLGDETKYQAPAKKGLLRGLIRK